MDKKPNYTHRLSSRRGVGAIIGGVILAGILLTTVLVYFISILNNEKTRASLEIQAQQNDREKATETYKVQRDILVPGGNIDINIENNGPIPMIASQMLVYCEQGCSDPASKPMQTTPLLKVLNPGDTDTEVAGGTQLINDNNHRYRIDVISERGNIVSSLTCTVQSNGSCSEDTSGGGGEPCIECAVDTGIIQGTGSIKLDFKAFGAIYPDWKSRNGIEQNGWYVNVTSPFSTVPGYPGFDAMYGRTNPHITYVESARNMDPTGQDLILTRTTGLMTNTGQVNGQIPEPSYICKGDATTKTLSKYNEGTNQLKLTNTPAGSPENLNWKAMFFCSDQISNGGTGAPSLWKPCKQNCNQFGNLNALFMIARGQFDPIFSHYSQTIPYQGVTYGTNALLACIRGSDDGAACLAPNLVDTSATLKYWDTRSNMQNGVTIYLHLTGGQGAYHISLLTPDGNYTEIATPSPSVNGNYQVTLPTITASGINIGSFCTGVPLNDFKYMTLLVGDDYDSTGIRNTYYMTWGMKCN